jgi:transposase-like protein
VRSSEFYFSCLEKGGKVEQTLKAALAEAYVLGVSRRQAQELTDELCDKQIFSTN